jgi:TolB-like protein/Tfp pilus assembly protein PilF
MNLKNYISELKRRNVFKASVAYIVVAWIITQVASIALPTFDAPPFVLKTILFLMVIGFPLNLLFAWAYELTPDGIKKTKEVKSKESITRQTSSNLNNVIIASLIIAVIYLLYNQLWDTPIKIGVIVLLSIAAIILLFIQIRNKRNNKSENEDSLENIETNEIDKKSIAVLAFADLSPKKDQEYFSDGISEELLNLLAKISELRVISRTSSFSYKGKNKTVEKIGKELDVTHILEGSVRKSGNQLRITTQLIQVSDGSHLWSETYDRDMEDIFKIQDEIANVVVGQLKIRLLDKLAKTNKVDPEAYSLYLQANYFYQHFSDKDMIKAEEIIRKSIDIDSTYAPSWFLMSAILRESTFNFSQIPHKKGKKLAITAAQRAIEIDNNYASPYAILSIIYLTELDYISAKENIDKAIDLDSGNSFVISSAALNAGYSGRIEEAMELYNKSLKVDPLRYGIYLNLAIGYYWLNHLDSAFSAVRNNIYYRPNAGIHHAIKSKILIGQGKHEEALKEAEKETNDFLNLHARNLALSALERYKEADRLLIQIIETYGETHWSNIAEIYAFRGDLENAFKWLNIAFEQSDNALVEVINDPILSNLHDDPQWQFLLDKMKLPKGHWLLKN